MTRLHFSIGADEPFPFTVDGLSSGEVELQRTSYPETETIQIPPERWERFWREVDKVGLWKWKTEYTRKTGDGTSWALEIAYNGRQLKTHGYNAFPESEGPADETYYPPGGQFDRFIQAIARLVGIPVDQIGSEPSDYD